MICPTNIRISYGPQLIENLRTHGIIVLRVEQKTKQTHAVGNANAIDHNCSDAISLHRSYSPEISVKDENLQELIILKPLLIRFIYIRPDLGQASCITFIPMDCSTGQPQHKDICLQTAPKFSRQSDFLYLMQRLTAGVLALWLSAARNETEDKGNAKLHEMKLKTRGMLSDSN